MSRAAKKTTVKTPASASRCPLFLLPDGSQLKRQVVAKALNINEETVTTLIDEGKLSAVNISDRRDQKRNHLRIQKFTVVAWWLENFFQESGVEFPYDQT